jgi:hypothetical protein
VAGGGHAVGGQASAFGAGVPSLFPTAGGLAGGGGGALGLVQPGALAPPCWGAAPAPTPAPGGGPSGFFLAPLHDPAALTPYAAHGAPSPWAPFGGGGGGGAAATPLSQASPATTAGSLGSPASGGGSPFFSEPPRMAAAAPSGYSGTW